MAIRKSLAVKDEAFRLLAMTPVERVSEGLPLTYQEIAQHVGVHLQTLYHWMDEKPHLKLFNKSSDVQLAKHARGKLGKEPIQSTVESVPDAEYDSDNYLTSRSEVADKALLRACEKGNANALRTYYQLTKRLVEKQEVTHKIDGSFFARAEQEAEQQLRNSGYIQSGGGVEEVQKEPSLLRSELCLPSGQGEGADDTVRGLATSPETDESASE